ncbi:hypothetical protein NMECO18_22005 [Escherichia coli]|nr:hypothetical protein NMECO18_22005 [Escherichia coli]
MPDAARVPYPAYGSATVVGLIRRDSVASGIDCRMRHKCLIRPTGRTSGNRHGRPINRNTEHAKHNPVLVCPGNDQSHHRCLAERLGRAQRRQPDAAPG